MPSLDIVSRIDMQEVSNAVNNARKAIGTRFDFRGAKAEIDLDRKEKTITLLTEDNTKLEALREMLVSAAIKRNIDLKALDVQDPEPAAAGHVRRVIKIREGLDQDLAKRIVKQIKDTKIKVQASIQGDEVRLSGKNIDDLRAVMAMLDDAGFEAPLQYVNMKR